jgi:hypothetical protein
MELQLALQELSKQGVEKHNWYKYFLPTKIEQTIQHLNLNCSPEELSQQWLEWKDLIH